MGDLMQHASLHYLKDPKLWFLIMGNAGFISSTVG